MTDVTPRAMISLDPTNPTATRRARAETIFHEFVSETYPFLREFAFKNIPARSDYFAVIVEPRPDPMLDYVLRNVMHFLGDGWGLQIFTSAANEAFVRRIVDGWETVYVDILGKEDFSREDFRKLRKSADYWALLRGEHLLCFETDSILCRRGVDKFLEYDYVGAPWVEGMALSDMVRVGNGGLSLRRRSCMVDLCITCKGHPIPSEDTFFSLHLHLKKDKYRVAPVEVAQRFSVESMYYESPVGIHKAWAYLSDAQLEVILGKIRY